MLVYWREEINNPEQLHEVCEYRKSWTQEKHVATTYRLKLRVNSSFIEHIMKKTSIPLNIETLKTEFQPQETVSKFWKRDLMLKISDSSIVSLKSPLRESDEDLLRKTPYHKHGARKN